MSDSNEWAKQIRDVIASDEGVSEGLKDDEALPLIEWGHKQAAVLGAQIADEAKASETGHTLARLMKRITWLAVYRHEKDAAWVEKTVNEINDLNHQLRGADAPVLATNEVSSKAQASNGELVQHVMNSLTPQAAPPPSLTADLLPGTAAPTQPAAPTSTSITADILPGTPTPAAPPPVSPPAPSITETLLPPATPDKPPADAPATPPHALPGRLLDRIKKSLRSGNVPDDSDASQGENHS